MEHLRWLVSFLAGNVSCPAQNVAFPSPSKIFFLAHEYAPCGEKMMQKSREISTKYTISYQNNAIFAFFPKKKLVFEKVTLFLHIFNEKSK